MDVTEAPRDHITAIDDVGAHPRRLLAWYDRHRRDLPWRAAPGERPDPYRVWLSEIMLQQTTVATVAPYFRSFIARWPDIEALAAAPLDDVLVAWQGLGYYARARNLVKCAGAVSDAHGGVFPETAAELVKLPGIGPYTAAAIAAIAFGTSDVVVDGNVERVIARLHAVAQTLPAAKPELRRLATGLTPRRRAGDYAQAMMDLGATVCTPRAPECGLCPLAGTCRAYALGDPVRFPKRAPSKRRPVRRGTAWFAINERGEVLLRRRPESGLLGGMMEVPSSPWQEEPVPEATTSKATTSKATVPEATTSKATAPPVVAPPVVALWHQAGAPVVHVFTHFRLELEVAWARVPAKDGAKLAPDGVWVAPGALSRYALPTVMKKVCRVGFAALSDELEGRRPAQV